MSDKKLLFGGWVDRHPKLAMLMMFGTLFIVLCVLTENENQKMRARCYAIGNTPEQCEMD
ncbi:MAG: hypothetical protein IJ560_02385 [Alphaproteobacteria bacterium]|nr:hypothetical protein [Alphaproteobacteria bacterium]